MSFAWCARLLAAVLAAARVAAVPAPADRMLTVRRFPSVATAVAATLSESEPVVIGFGEWHQTRDTLATRSTLRRFNEEILPVVAPHLSHLIVETWMTSGRCGEAEAQVTEDIARTIDRPAQTEDEIEIALRAAHAHGAAPRILTLSCDDYRAMRGEGTGVDYDRTLRLTGQALGNAILAAVAERNRQDRGAGAAGVVRPWVGVYGGALHNDVYPAADLAAYSYAPAIALAALGRFVEIDLIVPEYAASMRSLRAQDWWPLYRRARRPCGAVRIRRGPHSFVIVFPEISGRCARD